MGSNLKIGVVGSPDFYGGAGAELKDQLTLWKEMGYEIHIVPTGNFNGSLLNKVRVQAQIHLTEDYQALKGMPVISFCNDIFLRDIKKIKKYAKKTIFVNCMTWLFEAEKQAHQKGLIDLFLYQSDHQQARVNDELKKINKDYNWKIFVSWFDTSDFPFYKNRPTDKFRFGRISREDADKYSANTLWIYETMVAPVDKSGIILGFDHRSESKIGKPQEWIRTYPGCGITQQEFYAHCACIIQKCDTFENWPRVGMEAMASGSVLIVDNRGGWQKMVKHGETGWLCNDQRDFVYYASRMAYEPKEREKMAEKAYAHLMENIINKEQSKKDWKEIFAC